MSTKYREEYTKNVPTPAAIRIDGEIFSVLQDAAVDFNMQFSSPRKVLRVLLGIDDLPKGV